MGPTLIGLLQESVVKYPSLAALKHGNPEGGQRTVTYAELYTAVKELGTGLISIGLDRGTHVAILSENNPRWLVADLAIIDANGRVKVDNKCATSRPGVFAAGDVTDVFIEQVLIAVGEGAKAALSAYEYLLNQ